MKVFAKDVMQKDVKTVRSELPMADLECRFVEVEPGQTQPGVVHEVEVDRRAVGLDDRPGAPEQVVDEHEGRVRRFDTGSSGSSGISLLTTSIARSSAAV